MPATFTRMAIDTETHQLIKKLVGTEGSIAGFVRGLVKASAKDDQLAFEAMQSGHVTLDTIKVAIDALRKVYDKRLETLESDIAYLKDTLKPILKDYNARMREREREWQLDICKDAGLDYDREFEFYMRWWHRYSMKHQSPEALRREAEWREEVEKGQAPFEFSDFDVIEIPLNFTEWLIKRGLGIKHPGRNYEKAHGGDNATSR